MLMSHDSSHDGCSRSPTTPLRSVQHGHTCIGSYNPSMLDYQRPHTSGGSGPLNQGSHRDEWVWRDTLHDTRLVSSRLSELTSCGPQFLQFPIVPFASSIRMADNGLPSIGAG